MREWATLGRTRRQTALVFAGFLAVAIAGCAAPRHDPGETAEGEDANDPLESVNRDIFAFNLELDRDAVRPAAQTYRGVPEILREGVHNFLVTLASPVIFANDLLQGELDRAADTMTRLVINLTAGVGGFFDVAKDRGGIEGHQADFGQTLGDASTLSEGGAARLATEATERDKARPTTGRFREGRNSAPLGTLVRAIETARCAARSGASVSAAT